MKDDADETEPATDAAAAAEPSAEPYVPGKEIVVRFHVCDTTLRSWANDGRVRCLRIGSSAGKRLYSLPDVEKILHVPPAPKTRGAAAARAAAPRARVVYCRVSSAKQRPDLVRQREYLAGRYPDHEVVEDIASGIDFHRRGLLAVLDRAIRGDVGEVVVSNRDRLCRIAFELVEHVLGQCGCKVVVCDQDDADAAPAAGAGDAADPDTTAAAELQEDLMSITTYFVASNN